MKRFVPLGRPLFLLMLLLPGMVLAEAESDLALSLGYRLDELDWNINGENNPLGSDPNILSELEWRDLDILELKAEIVSTSREGIVFRGNLSHGWVLDGTNRDSDYAGSNRTLEFSRSVNDVEGSRVLDLSGGLGNTFFFGETEQYRFIPMAGYSYHKQALRMTNGNQVLWDSGNAAILDPSLAGSQPLGPFPGLNSTYDAVWTGPWLAADVIWDAGEAGRLFARAEYHWVNYSAQANWNLRSDFAHPVSFKHTADGTGQVLELGWQQAPSRYYWVLGISLKLQSWATGRGVDRIFFADGSVGETGLNEVNWSSQSIHFVLRKSFGR